MQDCLNPFACDTSFPVPYPNAVRQQFASKPTLVLPLGAARVVAVSNPFESPNVYSCASSLNVLPDILPVRVNISEDLFSNLLILSHAFLANIS